MKRNKVDYSIVVFIMLSIPFLTNGQDTAIHFNSGLSWKEIQAKAKAENKYIFMDCYATWCGPCKWMGQHIFTQKEAGDFFNAHFINVAVQMDKTQNDGVSIRDWYADADSIKNNYRVSDYPTYLFFSPDGVAVHLSIGSASNVKDFISTAVDAMDPSRQYYTKMGRWKEHKTDTAFLWQTYKSALDEGDVEQAKLIGKAFLDCQHDLLTARNLLIITQCGLIQSSTDKWFKLFLDSASRIGDSLNGISGVKNFVAWELKPVIFSEEIEPLYHQKKPIYWKRILEDLKRKYPTLGNDLITVIEERFRHHLENEIASSIAQKDQPVIDWNQLAGELKREYPDYNSDKILLTEQANYYAHKKLWEQCVHAVYDLMHRYGDQLTENDMNDMVWNYVFEHCADRRILSESLKWQKRVIMKGDREDYIDTYANLLYKTGDKDKAIQWEEKAIDAAVMKQADPRVLKIYQKTLEKMKKGEPTWDNTASS
jgi:thiol-disulfide isomerase/thioredoxin